MRAAWRQLVAAVASGAVAALAFSIMIQGSFRQGYTDLDFNHVLGTMIKGTAEEQRGADAFSVVGDTAGPAGVYGTLIGAVALMLLFGLVIAPLVRRGWVVQGLVLGAVTALVVGVGFCAVADARLDTPTGIFGVDAGGFTPVVIVLCSLGFGVVGARAHTLMTTAGWLEVKQDEIRAEIETISGLEPSLELPEQGREERRVGP